MHEVLVNCLGGLSLPRKSVVRLTDHPDMTLDVYRGCKTTMQRLFPDVLQFSIPSDRSKKIIFIFYFNGVNCITSNLGATLKGKNLLPKGANSFLYEKPNAEGGLDYLMRMYILSPLEQNK